MATQGKVPTAMKYLGEKYGIDKGRFRVRLTYADGKTTYKRFETELDARAFMGRVVAQW